MQTRDAGGVVRLPALLLLLLLPLLFPLSIAVSALAIRILVLDYPAAGAGRAAATFLAFDGLFTVCVLLVLLVLLTRSQRAGAALKAGCLALLAALWLAGCVLAQLRLLPTGGVTSDAPVDGRLARAAQATAWTSFALVCIALGAMMLSALRTSSVHEEGTRIRKEDVEAEASSMDRAQPNQTHPDAGAVEKENKDGGGEMHDSTTTTTTPRPPSSLSAVSSSILSIFTPSRRKQQDRTENGRGDEGGEGTQGGGVSDDWEIVDIIDAVVPSGAGVNFAHQPQGGAKRGRKFKRNSGANLPGPRSPPPSTALPALPPPPPPLPPMMTTATTGQQHLFVQSNSIANKMSASASTSTFVGSTSASFMPASSTTASYSRTELGTGAEPEYAYSPVTSMGQGGSSIHTNATGTGTGTGTSNPRRMSILRLPQSLTGNGRSRSHSRSQSQSDDQNSNSHSQSPQGTRKVEPNPHMQAQTSVEASPVLLPY
ncbi:unnamed protein product [Tilletia controversa]|nr:unnamed protein product [Tilletia controversa]